MTVEAFGYTALTLDELIDAAQKLREAQPKLATQPVWVEGERSVHRPVNAVIFLRKGIMLTRAGSD